MKVRLFTILAFMTGVLSANVSSAQELPLMPQDPVISSAMFPNGLSCYLAENKSTEDIADFSLMRRNYDGKDLVCAHKDVIVSSETVVDSLLLSLMRRVESDKSPADYAIVICGDIDASSVMKKLQYMSLMVDSSVPSAMPEYVWNGNGKAVVNVLEDKDKNLSTLHVGWQVPHIAESYRNTILSAVYQKTTWELGEIAKELIERTLHKHEIPYADVSYRYDDCTGGAAHQGFAVDVTVQSGDMEKTRQIVVSVLSFLNQGRTYMNDFLLAEHEYMIFLEKSAARSVRTNEEYTRVCREAFLYNMPLSTDKERLAYLKSKDVPESSRREMFSKMTSAVLDVDTPEDTIAVVSSAALLTDTLVLPGQSLKQKIRTSRKDSFSGGTKWTFVNGFKVIYKKMPTGRKLYYSMSLSGGYGNVEDLEKGEGAYMSDYLDHCWISGMKGSYFKELLSLSGMSMDVKVNLLSTVISGQVENRNATLLMKALLAVANERRSNPVELEYFADCDKLRLTMQYDADLRATFDELMCPGFRYSPFKTEEGVGYDTFNKAEALFASLTSKMNDGILVIVGDMDETELRKLLQVYVGGFDVKNVASRRPSINYHPISGWPSYSAEGDKDAAYMVVTAPFAMTSSNHFAVEIAMMIFERRVKKVFEAQGYSVNLSYTRGIYPDERLSLMVELGGKCDSEELPQLRDILVDCQKNMTEEELNAYKGYVKNMYELQLLRPEYWLRVITLRHLEGKDFTTGYDAKIDGVSMEQIQNVFKALNKGAGMDYITTRK